MVPARGALSAGYALKLVSPRREAATWRQHALSTIAPQDVFRGYGGAWIRCNAGSSG
jgi:hypothetical protein